MDVHIAVLKLAESWQSKIVADWKQQWKRKKIVSKDVQANTQIAVRIAAFNWLAVIICLYWAEGRQLLPLGRLQALCTHPDASQQLALLWQEFCARFGQKLLLKQFQLSDSLSPNSALIQFFIANLYYSNFEQTELSIHILGMLYEVNLSFFDTFFNSLFESNHQGETQHQLKFKKSNGIYYTPQSVVQHVVKQTIDSYFQHSHILQSAVYPLPQILDPTCGGGAFLLSAYQYLLDHCLEYQLRTWDDLANPALQRDRNHQLQLSFAERQRLLSAIHGVDLDPQAVAVTQVSLWLKLIETISNFDHSDSLSSMISTDSISVYCGNAIAALNYQPNCSQALHFQWQTAFPTHIPDGFDLVIGNPPYIDAEQMSVELPAWRTYCTAHYQTATGNWDLFCVFIEQALRLCREGGFTSLVVPNKLLSADYARAARQLLSQNHLISIRDYSQVSVFRASVYPIAYIAQKVSSQAKLNSLNTNQTTIYERMQTLNQVREVYDISLSSEMAMAQAWVIGDHSTITFIQRLEQLPKLETVAQVLGAATVAEAYLLRGLIQERETPAATDLRLVNSGTIDRYLIRWGEKPLRYLRQTYSHPIVSEASLASVSTKRLTQAKQRKIMVAGMSQRLECAFDPSGAILAGKSTVIVLPFQGAIDLRYLLGILNSRLASFYVLNRFQGNRLQGGYLRIGAPQLRQIPIALPDPDQPEQQNQSRRIIELVEYRLQLTVKAINLPTPGCQQEIQEIEQKIDALVYALYQLENKEIEIIVNDPHLLAIHR